ncbi:MAG: hypothetical protein ACOYJZ_01595 [Acutalibacter sp.]
MRNPWKRAALAVFAVVCALTLTGCSMTSFGDYDVSGYFQALLDSSYKNQNENYMTVAATTEEDAQQNNVTTVQNAAINFCNTYGISPSDEQLAQLEDVMRQMLAQANYLVKDEQKVETGYYLEVEIDPIVNFSDIGDELQKLRNEAKEEASQANESSSSQEEEDSYLSGEEYGSWEEDEESSQDEDQDGDTQLESQESSQTQESGEHVDANELFVDKVVEFCQQQTSTVRYKGEAITISLDIRQTEDGELQLDTNQLDTIDRTVLQFQS